MYSSRKSFSADRGTGRGGSGRRDSGDPKKGTKCRNFNPQTGERKKDCIPGCGFAHPSDPEWNTATGRAPGSMGPPRDIPRHARDSHRDSGWGRGASSRSSGPRSDRSDGKDPSITSTWATTIDVTSFNFSDVPNTGNMSSSSSGWGDSGRTISLPANNIDGWGVPEPPKAKPAASSDLDGWGVAGPATPTTKPVSETNDANVINDADGWGIPETRSSTEASKGWESPVRETAVAMKSTPTPASEDPRADGGWAGMAKKRAANLPDPHPLLPSNRPPPSTQKQTPYHPPHSPLYPGFSFGKSHSRRSSTDNDNPPSQGNNTAVVKPNLALDKPDRPVEDRPKETSTVVSLSPTLPNAPPSRSNSTTPKPSLKIVLPTQPPEHQSAALSLILQSPFSQFTHSSPARGEATMKSPPQLAWSGHIEILSRAVTAQMERMQLNNVINDRQRLIFRIKQRSGRPMVPSILDTTQENKTQDADAKLQAAMAALTQTTPEDGQGWWPTPRAGVDYEKVLTSLENDIENLQQLLGEPDATDDKMEVDTLDSGDFEALRKKRKSVFHEVQSMLPYIAERLRTAETFVKNQTEGLNGHISRILDKAHPPSTIPGASGLAKLEDLRSRFEKLEHRMNAYLPDLQRRRTLAIQRTADLKALRTRYEELRRGEQELVARKKKFTKDAQKLLTDMSTETTMEERVLQLTTSPAAQERMMRMMVPKLLEIADNYRSEDLEYAIQCQVTARADVEAWRVAREQERKLRGESFLKGLENDSAIKAVELAGKEIDRRWNEVVSVQKVPRRSPAIRIPGTG